MRSRTPNETPSGITGFLPTDASMTSLAARCAPPRQLHAIPPLAPLGGKSCVPPFERFRCLGEIAVNRTVKCDAKETDVVRRSPRPPLSPTRQSSGRPICSRDPPVLLPNSQFVGCARIGTKGDRRGPACAKLAALPQVSLCRADRRAGPRSARHEPVEPALCVPVRAGLLSRMTGHQD